MIICPHCRNANEEEAVACTRCGAPLEPGPTFLLARRPPTERPPLDITKPKPPSPWRAIVLLGVVAGVGVGAALWFAFRPDRCEGANFTSDQFGYCLTMPEDWQWTPAKFGDSVTVDQFGPPTQSATVLVEAADLPDDADLETFADVVRQKDEDAGLSPERIDRTSVDGAEALSWDIHYTSGSGHDYSVREVVVVNDHFGWRIVLNDTAESFDRHASQFESMVDSFRFT
jgi:hypothetical protein